MTTGLPNYSRRSIIIAISETQQASLLTCNRCGAAVLVISGEPPTAQVFHDRWHEKMDA